MCLSFRGYREPFGNWRGPFRLEVLWSFTVTTATTRKMPSVENNIGAFVRDYFLILPSCSHYTHGEVRYNWLVCAKLNYLYIVMKHLVLHSEVVSGDFTLLGSLRSYDGNCKENVWRLNFARSEVFSRLFHIHHVVQNRWSVLSLAWHEWFPCKGNEWKIYCCELALLSEPQIWKFHVVVWQTTSKHCTKKRAARAARLFFFIQPIKSLISGVVVDVAVVKS